MARRSARYKSRETNFSSDENIHPLFPARGGWNPRDGAARYLKN